MPFVRKLIAEFDANVDFAKPVTRALRYISASDVLPVLVQAFTEPGENQQGGETGAPGGNQNQQNQRRNPTASTSNPYTGSTGESGSSLNVSEELLTEPVDTTPESSNGR